MKYVIALILALTLTACGTDEPKQYKFEANLPATFTHEGTIVTEGVVLGSDKCNSVWPTVMPYEVDGAGDYHAGEQTFAPVVGNWSYAGARVNGWLPVTTFTIGDDSVFVKLKCFYKEPIEHAL